MKYFIKTFGCQMNASDSERIAGLLKELGFQEASKIQEADLAIFNLCSVRQTAVDRIYGQFNLKSNLNKSKKKTKVFITGCILENDKKKIKEKVDGIFDIRELDKSFKKEIIKILKNEKNDFKTKLLNNRDLEATYLKIRPKYKFKDQAFVPIMTGCDNFCSYCVVPYTRGREWSRSKEEILNEVKDLIKNSYQEIVLLGQNVNSYKGKDENGKEIDFADLLKSINNLSGNFQISFLTSHPKDMSDKLIKVIAKGEKIKKEIHLPFQAGDDEILKKMNRKYTQKDYLNLIEKIKKEIPNVILSTDVIVGFPGETEKQFQETLKVIEKVGFKEVFINKYSPRKGTIAFKKYQDNISWSEKKRRWKEVFDLVEKINNVL